VSDVSSTRSKSRQTEVFRDAIDFKARKERGDRFFLVGPVGGVGRFNSVVTTEWVVTCLPHMKSGMERGRDFCTKNGRRV